jgi:hypothetical protein
MAEKNPRLGVLDYSVLDVCFSFDVGRSMFDVGRSSLKTTLMNVTSECAQDNIAITAYAPAWCRER